MRVLRGDSGAGVNHNDGLAKSQPAQHREVVRGSRRRGDKLLVPLGVQTGICPLRGAKHAACSPVVHWVLQSPTHIPGSLRQGCRTVLMILRDFLLHTPICFLTRRPHHEEIGVLLFLAWEDLRRENNPRPCRWVFCRAEPSLFSNAKIFWIKSQSKDFNNASIMQENTLWSRGCECPYRSKNVPKLFLSLIILI